MNEFRPHLLDTGDLSWGIDEEHVYTCPCGSWQLHVPKNAALTMRPVREVALHIGGVRDIIMAAIRDLNAAVDDALWEHEAECPVLQHAATQAGIVRREPFHPYVLTPEAYAEELAALGGVRRWVR